MCHARIASRIAMKPHVPEGPPRPPDWCAGLDRQPLAAAAERIWRQAIAAAQIDARAVPLTLRREVAPDGRRLWAIRQDRDPYVIYLDLPRAFMALRPGRRARAMLAYVRDVVDAARASVPSREVSGVAPLSR